MLLRMYLKWAERRGFKREVLDYQPGEEAGIKSATFTLTGDYAFGLMAAEAGVHRLVRISPFDQAARRHTSFASVYVWPRDRGGHRHRDSGKGSAHRHLSIERRRRPARQRHRLRRPHHAPADRHRRLVPERAVAAQESRRRDEGAEGAALRHEAEGAAGQARTDRRRQEGHRLRQPDPQLRAAAVPDDQGPPHEASRSATCSACSTATSMQFIKTYLMQKASGTLGTALADDDE